MPIHTHFKIRFMLIIEGLTKTEKCGTSIKVAFFETRYPLSIVWYSALLFDHPLDGRAFHIRHMWTYWAAQWVEPSEILLVPSKLNVHANLVQLQTPCNEVCKFWIVLRLFVKQQVILITRAAIRMMDRLICVLEIILCIQTSTRFVVVIASSLEQWQNTYLQRHYTIVRMLNRM